jgi:hypothetical protein
MSALIKIVCKCTIVKHFAKPGLQPNCQVFSGSRAHKAATAAESVTFAA